MGRVRYWLISKLIGKYKFLANVTVTSDIVNYNAEDLYLYNVKVNRVSRTQSFVYNPNNIKVVG